MLAKLSTLAFVLPLASALTILPTQGTWASGNTVTIQWQAATTDPGSFSIELVNTAFNKQYAIANNVVTSNGQISLQVPEILSGDGYSLVFVANNNDQQVYASSGDFAVDSATSTSGTASSTSSGASTASSASSSASFSTPSVTGTLSSPSSVPTVSTGSTSSAASAAPSTFNSSGAASFKLAAVAPAAALVLSAVAGAVLAF